MADVVDISGRPSKKAAQPNQAVIARLKELLEHAESGQIQQIAPVWMHADGVMGDGYAPGGFPDELVPIIGQLEVLKATLLASMIGEGIE